MRFSNIAGKAQFLIIGRNTDYFDILPIPGIQWYSFRTM